MSSMILAQRNSSSAHLPAVPWLQTSASQFFGRFNWDDQPPEVQELKATAVDAVAEPLSLLLSTQQFFGAMNWDAEAIAPLSAPPVDTAPGADLFTLDDFSGLF
ncbi:MAG: hypothetical protein KME20_13580 [Kaiparowitsia implicata GSE-PSE-MK54-09C]|jgi:hypothetical protein|nr:hypothetical protein [Kaiparowitsia implicata GSE-PSE-MK54-09C]